MTEEKSMVFSSYSHDEDYDDGEVEEQQQGGGGNKENDTPIILVTTSRKMMFHSSLQRPKTNKTPSVKKQDMRNVTNSWKSLSIRPLPDLFIIEQTSFVVINQELESILFKTKECLRLRSVRVEYDNEQVIARCETSSFTRFYIYLYKGNSVNKKSQSHSSSLLLSDEYDEYDNDDNSILVEIQRRSGSTMDFYDEFSALKQAIQFGVYTTPDSMNDGPTKGLMPNTNMNRKRRGKFTELEMDLKSILGDKYIPLPVESILSNVRMAAKNITSSLSTSSSQSPTSFSFKNSSIVFGFETLISITNTTSSSKNTAFQASKMIMTKEEFSNVRHAIMSELVTSCVLEDPSSSEIIAEKENDSFVPCISLRERRKDMMNKKKCLALTLLINILSNLLHNNTNEEETATTNNNTSNQKNNNTTSSSSSLLLLLQSQGIKEHLIPILPSLLTYLNQAGNDPNLASLSAKCLSLLFLSHIFTISSNHEYQVEISTTNDNHDNDGEMMVKVDDDDDVVVEKKQIVDALMFAKKIGMISYYRLEMECTQALHQME